MQNFFMSKKPKLLIIALASSRIAIKCRRSIRINIYGVLVLLSEAGARANFGLLFLLRKARVRPGTPLTIL